MNKDNYEIGERIAKFRKSAGMSQKELKKSDLKRAQNIGIKEYKNITPYPSSTDTR